VAAFFGQPIFLTRPSSQAFTTASDVSDAAAPDSSLLADQLLAANAKVAMKPNADG